MPYVITTASNDIYYGAPVANPSGDLHRRGRQVLIKGGSSIAQKKTLITPHGVSTHVTDDELEFLESCASFQRHKKAGHVKVVKSNADPEKVAKDMTESDGASPKMAEKIAASTGAKPAEGSAKEIVKKSEAKAKG